MPKNTATLVSIRRKAQAFARAQRRNPDRYRILAEGDSWFTTPVEGWKGPTLIDSLKRHRSGGRRPFNIVMVANPTTELRSTIDPNNIDIALATLDDWIGNQTYDMVLLSTGGNDVLGTEMRMLLRDPADAAVRRCLDAAATLEEQARCIVDCEKYCALLAGFASRLRAFRRSTLKPNGLRRARILIHGYDYPIPNGSDMEVFGGLVHVGPWLLPAFEDRNTPEPLYDAVLKLMIDEFNRMLRDVALSQNLFHYVDLRNTLSGEEDWADEIHPHSDTGIPKLSARLQDAIKAVRDGRAGSVIGSGQVDEEYSCGCDDF